MVSSEAEDAKHAKLCEAEADAKPRTPEVELAASAKLRISEAEAKAEGAKLKRREAEAMRSCARGEAGNIRSWRFQVRAKLTRFFSKESHTT